MLKIRDTVELHARLLRRAQSECLVARRDPDDPHVAWVSSSNIPDHWYRVTRESCACPANKHQGDCKHRVLACHLADNGRMPFRNAGEFVSAAGTSLLTQVQAGWVSDDRDPVGRTHSETPSLHDLRTGKVKADHPADAERLTWSYCN